MTDIPHPGVGLPSPPARWDAVRTRLRRVRGLAGQALRSPTTLVGAIIITLLIGMAIFAPLIVEPNVPDPYQMPRDWGNVERAPGHGGPSSRHAGPTAATCSTASSGGRERRSAWP